MTNLFEKITSSENSLSKFKQGGKTTACIYPNPYKGKSEVVRWLYSRNNGCQVFFACSKEISDRIDEESWADVDDDFTYFVEGKLMPYCVENTDWLHCERYGIGYDKKLSKKDAESAGCDTGCEGTICHCEPFGEGDFTYGIAEEDEFTL